MVVLLIPLILYVSSPSFLLLGAFVEEEGKEVVSKCVNKSRMCVPVGDNPWTSQLNKDACVSVNTSFNTSVKLGGWKQKEQNLKTG